MKIFYALGFLAFIISGCAAPPVYKLQAVDNIDYYKGREIVTKDMDSLQISAEADNYQNGEMTFYIQVENNSGSKVFIEPKEFFVDVASEDFSTINTLYPRYFARDPEKEIAKITEDMESQKSQHSFVYGANAFLALVSIAADVTDKKEKHKADHVSDDISVWADNQTNENIDYNNSLNNMNSSKEYWKNQALRKTDLYPGENVGGQVFVHASAKARYFKLYVPVGDDTCSFMFKKIIVNK